MSPDIRKKIAIFGGSFDPVHLGHLGMIKAAREQAELDEVRLMPCWQSPFKDQTIATGEQRYKMLQLAVEELSYQSWASVSRYEIDRPQRSYSWQTVQHLRSEQPDAEWCWLLGTDQWQQIEQWAESERLRNWLKFIVVSRDGEAITSRPDWNYQQITFSHPASSTDIRRDFAKYSDWVANSTKELCVDYKLYL